jgi:hypothetical protein
MVDLSVGDIFSRVRDDGIEVVYVVIEKRNEDGVVTITSQVSQ